MKIEFKKNIIIELKNEYDYEMTCGGCPTIFEFKDKDKDKLYFYLRNGCWRLFNETTNEVLASGYTDKFDGICNWDDALELMKTEGVIFNLE